MKQKTHVLLFGLIARTTAYLLRDGVLKNDAYNECILQETFWGGETGTAAALLAEWGVDISLYGNFISQALREDFIQYYKCLGVDITGIRYSLKGDELFDHVYISREKRTIFGAFDSFFQRCAEDGKLWNPPSEEEIVRSDVVALDPYFGQETLVVAKCCHTNGIPFVTIDIPPSHPLCPLASVIVVSQEFIRANLPQYEGEEKKRQLLREYTENTPGLVILTDGSNPIHFQTAGEKTQTLKSFTVPTVSTLGAGDAFRAGCVYGLLQRWGKEELVRFAAACGTLACKRISLASDPLGLEEVWSLLNV